MILRNKTNGVQTLKLKDGSVVSAKPYRTVVLGETVEFDSAVWEVISAAPEKVVVEKKAKVVESTPRGK